MIGIWKKHLDKTKQIGVILMELSEAFDSIIHSLGASHIPIFVHNTS